MDTTHAVGTPGSGNPTGSDPTQDLPKLYDDLAEVFERFTTSLESNQYSLQEWLASYLPGGGRALDVGCGAGRYCTMLAERYDEVVGVDPAGAMLDIARATRARPNIRYEQRDIFDVLPDKDGTFDMVFAFSAIFLMKPYDRILPHLRQLVAPGGRLVVFDPERPAMWGEEDWQTTYAFDMARRAYKLTGQAQTAQAALGWFLHPGWRAISGSSQHIAPSREEFHREYSAHLPGVTFADDIYLGFGAATWQAPDGN